MAKKGIENRGFAGMTLKKRREIAAKGGRAAHAKGTAYEWDSEAARNAGRKGGQATFRKRKAVSAPAPADTVS